MTRDEILKLAREAGYSGMAGTGVFPEYVEERLKRFATLIAAAEREACAKVCEGIAADRWALYKGRPPYTGSEDGRACQQTQGENIGAEDCASAIRARGES